MRQRVRGDSGARWCDGSLDAVIALLAAWTVAYHVCLLLRLGTTVALLITLLLLLVGGVVERRTRGAAQAAPASLFSPAHRDRRPPDQVLLVGLAAATATSAIAMATRAPWWLVWVPWLLAAGAGVWWALRRAEDPVPEPLSVGTGLDRFTPFVVAAWAIGLAALAACLVRTNPDDLYYLNLSQWVADHGTFPLRDTLYSDGLYPMSNWPPTASYDALVGTVARLCGVRAGSVEYLVIPPLATALSVLALWRLLRAWRTEWVAYALSTALVFLLFNGALGYGNPGGLFVSRLWQGKVILLCLLVPLILARSVGFAERPSRRGAAGLALAGAAATALSTTALFLVPVLALAGAAPLVRRAPRWAVVGFLATSAYTLAGLAATVLLGGRSADDFGDRRLYRFDPQWIGHAVFLTGPLTVVAVAAVLLAAVLIPHPAARTTSALLGLVLGLVLTPGVVRLSYDITGLGPTLWRLSWGCTVAALVGVGAVRLTRWTSRRLSGRRIHERWALVLSGALLPVLLVSLGEPVWVAGHPSFNAPTHWKRSTAALDATRTILRASKPGDIVLAPDSVAITVAVSSTDVKTVSPRAYYMAYLRGVPGFHYAARQRLEQYVNEGSWRPRAVRHALHVVGVRTVCLSPYALPRATALIGTGYVPLNRGTGYRCWQRG